MDYGIQAVVKVRGSHGNTIPIYRAYASNSDRDSKWTHSSDSDSKFMNIDALCEKIEYASLHTLYILRNNCLRCCKNL